MIRILDIFGVPGWDSPISAQCEWSVPPEIFQRAAGGQVRIATHVKTLAGETVLHDGPRSAPLQGTGRTERFFVPLQIPGDLGACRLEFDAVVEGQFWGSSVGFAPAACQLELTRPRQISWSIPGQDQQRAVRVQGGTFKVPHESYGFGDTERAIEIPWVLSRYRDEGCVLDLGSANAEPRYLQALSRLQIPCLLSLDLARNKGGPARTMIGDARRPPVKPAAIDLIFAISVIEHIGRDNRVYVNKDPGPLDLDGDFETVRALASLLRPAGRLLITLPFGRFQDHGWFIQYDLDRVERLAGCADLELVEMEFYEYRDGWRGPVPPGVLAEREYQSKAAAAASVACLTLRRPGRARGALARWFRHGR